MRSNTLIQLLLAAFCLCFAAEADLSAQQGKKKNKKNKNKGTELDSGQLIELEAGFFEAKRAVLKNDYEKATALLNDILRFQPENDAALYELSKIKVEERKMDEAIELAQRAAEVDPSNTWYQYRQYELFSMANRYDEAAIVLEKLIKDNPGNIDNYFELAYMQKLAGQSKRAIETLNLVEKKTGVDESLVLEKHRLYMQLNDSEGAAGELEKLITAYPKESQYYGMLAGLYRMLGKNDQAREVYQRLLKVNENDPYAQLYMGQDLYERGERQEGADMLRKAIAHPQLPIEEKVQILMSVAGSNGDGAENRALANELAEEVANSNPEDYRALLLYAEILEGAGEKEKALEYYQQALKLNSSDLNLWSRTFILLEQLRDYKGLDATAKEALEYFPNRPMVYYFRGIALNRTKDLEKSSKVLKQGILIGSDNKDLLAEMYALMGDNYNTLKKFDKSDSAFDQSLELSPDNALVLNNYSYYLSLREESLERAEELSLRSNELSPGNASFEDTYGWIKYKLGDFESAEEWLEKALKSGGDSRPVVLDHYGDVLFQLGKIDEAVSNWTKAKELGLDSEFIDQKISQRKLIE